MTRFQRFIIAVLAQFFLLGFFYPLSAQVITPPLDPSVQIFKPAAASWRYIKGENESDKERTATVAYSGMQTRGENDDQTFEWSGSASSLIMLAKTENVNIEAYYSPTSVQNITRTYDSGQTSKQDLETSDSQFHFSYLTGTHSFGGSFTSNESQLNNAKPVKQNSIGVAYTKQFARVFFLGVAVDQVKQDESYTAANTWLNYAWGGSLLAGKPDETQIRLEYSITRSAEAIGESDKLSYNIHQESDDLIMAAEIKLGDLLLSYLARTQTSKEFNDKVDGNDVYRQETIVKNNRIGVGNIPKNSWILSVYLSTTKYSNYWYDSSEPTGQVLMVNLGYNF